MMHLKAISTLQISNKFVCAIGLNIDVGHGIIESELIHRLTELCLNNIILNEIILNDNDDNPNRSIVQSLIISAIYGHRGYYIHKFLTKSIMYFNKLDHDIGIIIENRFIYILTTIPSLVIVTILIIIISVVIIINNNIEFYIIIILSRMSNNGNIYFEYYYI